MPVFYYPVFTILFLDYGLSIEQFSLLNTVWAITIVCAEIPSGALADILSRKYLLVGTAVIMVAEMSLLAFVPLGNSSLIFTVFLINRVLSGLAEAMASGADEAIAYDSLVAEGDPEDWPKVLSVQMRLRSIASVITMTVGALVYDPHMVNRLLAFFGSTATVTQQMSMRYPIYLTLVLAVLATVTALKMQEKPREKTAGGAPPPLPPCARPWRRRSGWRRAFCPGGDPSRHLVRPRPADDRYHDQSILSSHRPAGGKFGLIGSAMAVLGLITPKIAERMVAKNSPAVNVYWVSGINPSRPHRSHRLLPLLGPAADGPWSLLP